MGYLLIKKDDAKTFKSFLSGKEIEVGVKMDSSANIFSPDDEVYVFYDNDNGDHYRARITRQQRNNSFVLLALKKDSHRSSH